MTSKISVVICSHRLGGTDGVSIEAAKWQSALAALGHNVRTVAGSGTADIVIPGLSADGVAELRPNELVGTFFDADLVIVENICSLKLNPDASQAVAASLAGRRAIMHHHDLAIERQDRLHFGAPPDDPAWKHVVISNRARDELSHYAITARTIYNHFDPDPPSGDRTATRQHLSIGDQEILVLQPTRAIARKAIPVGLNLAESIGATYWLLGDAEDGYGDELDRVLAQAKTRVIRRSDFSPIKIDDAYAACDLVALPSTWEGFGNPAIESATHRRPLAIGDYPVARELNQFGFRWFAAHDAQLIKAFFAAPDFSLIEHNVNIARTYFSLDDLPAQLNSLISEASSAPVRS